MNTCKIRNIVLGEGTPKVCVPIVEQTKEEIIDSAKKINEVGADTLPTAPKVSAEPNASPLNLLIAPVPAIDIVIIGLSA